MADELTFHDLLIAAPRFEVQLTLTVFSAVFWFIFIKLFTKYAVKKYLDNHKMRDQFAQLSQLTFKNGYGIDFELDMEFDVECDVEATNPSCHRFIQVAVPETVPDKAGAICLQGAPLPTRRQQQSERSRTWMFATSRAAIGRIGKTRWGSFKTNHAHGHRQVSSAGWRTR